MTAKLRELINLLGGVGSISNDKLRNNPLVIGYVATGDGAYVIMNPLFGGYGILLAHAIRTHLLLVNKKNNGAIYDGVRAAVHLGPCIAYRDVTDKVNFAGDGLNDCARISGVHKSSGYPTQFTDDDYLVASHEAIACFEDRYITKIPQVYRDFHQYTKSNDVDVVDKHQKIHKVNLIEMNRFMVTQPFVPAVTLEEEKLALMRSLAKGIVPDDK